MRGCLVVQVADDNMAAYAKSLRDQGVPVAEIRIRL
jgi:hypothetical protein